MCQPFKYQSFGHWLILLLVLTSCTVKPRGPFASGHVPQAPDYAQNAHWAALPTKVDSADALPGMLTDFQDSASVDVFFVHPTTYTGKRGHNRWNAAIHDEKLNLRTDKGSIRFQASLFNGVGRVYAPRYRQAHLEAFYTKTKQAEARNALDLAYTDVRRAFQYYMANWNDGRPVIVAAHSQGTWHGRRLLREFFDGKPLKDQLVVAYLVGLPVTGEYFEDIPACSIPQQVQCYCSWRTVKEGFYPRKWPASDSVAVTNPISWTTDTLPVPRQMHKGAVLTRFDEGPYPAFTSARISGGYLWIPKPRIPGVLFLPTRNYHIADLNLFYMDIRENARLRTEAYFNDKS